MLSASLNKTFPSFLPSISVLRVKCSSMVECSHSWYGGSLDRFFMVDPLSYSSFQLVPHDWCNKGCGMCYPVYGMVHHIFHLSVFYLLVYLYYIYLHHLSTVCWFYYIIYIIFTLFFPF